MESLKKIVELLVKVRDTKPLVHQITNYVTVNDCANITLAIGASPVMADDIKEVVDMVSIASSLVINIGTLNSRTVESMIAAGKRANELGIPVVLDPVGAGATSFRTEVAKKIISEVKVAVIRGNLSEVKTLSGIETKTRGVDSGEELALAESQTTGIFDEAKAVAARFAKEYGAVVAITGATDIITDGEKIFLVDNGHKLMSQITGTGCMCTALIGSFVGTHENNLYGTLAGIVAMGIAGEIGVDNCTLSGENVNKFKGTGSLKVNILDAICNLSSEDIIRRGKVHEERC